MAPSLTRLTVLILATCMVMAPALSSCRLGGERATTEILSMDGEITGAEDLEGDVYTLRMEIAQMIRASADTIHSRAATAQTRRHAIIWKSRVVDRYQSILTGVDPAESIARGMIYTHQLREYLENGEGRTLFGTRQQLARDTMNMVDHRIEQVALRHFSDESVREMRDHAAQVARDYPMRGVFEEHRDRAFSLEDAGRQTVGLLARLPLAPVRTVGGVGRGVDNLTGLPGAAREISATVAEFPEDLRTQAELLLLHLTANDMVTTAVVSFERFSHATDRLADSSAQLAETADRLPEDIRATIDETLRQSSEHQETLRVTLADLSAAADQLRQLATAVGETGSTWETTARAVTGAVEAIDTLASREGTGEGRPFDIREYNETALSISRAAGELRATVAELRRLNEEAEIDRAVGTAASRTRTEADLLVDATADRIARIVDRVFVYTIVLLVVFFGLLILWRLIARRI